MNFSDKKYLEGLKNILKNRIEDSHTIYDCFYQLIEGLPVDAFDNLIKLMMNSKKLNKGNLTKEDCYNMLQNIKLEEGKKKIILSLAYNCLDSGLLLTDAKNEYGFNKSDWIAHSLQEARLCSIIASKCGLDSDKAFKLGILHDYGRKFEHSFKHVTIGFEKLYDLGYYDEAIGCLTHSFLNGNFFACYSPSNLYTVDDKLNAIPLDDKITNTDLFIFLNNYKYSSYDRVLNIADLMATSKKVVSPVDRILDIEKRRKMEGKQREFFLFELSKSIIWLLKHMKKEINTRNFEELSNEIYNNVVNKEKEKIAIY